jgi:elongation factor P
MIRASDITKGSFILINNMPHVCVDREYVNPGKGSAFVRLKLKNIKNGLLLRQTNKVQDNLEDISVEYRDVQYLYADPDNYVFMDTRTYEQFQIPIKGEEEKKDFLKDGEVYQIVFWEHRPVDIKLPTKMVFTVAQAEKAERGDTVSGATKTITCDTGLKVKVPLFIKQGDRILVNTETREYQERVNS